MLRDEVEKYSKLTGEDGWKVPVIKIGSYIDGYDKGLEVIDKIRADIEEAQLYKMFMSEDTFYIKRDDVLAIIDKYKSESEVER